MPLSLSETELQIVMEAARPIRPRDRNQFLRDVAAELEKHELLGQGLVTRICSKLQHQHLAPRTANHVGGKYGH